MKARVVILLLFVAVMIGCSDNDKGPTSCRPHALIYTTDSVVYAYESDHIKTVNYYGSGSLIAQDIYEYNASGKPELITKVGVFTDGRRYIDTEHTLSYNEAGLPSQLISDGYDGYFTTTFSQDVAGRLVSARTTVTRGNYYLGTTRYEYDENGNIPKVYYTINVNGTVKEVLARENTGFDSHEKFYHTTPELKVVNEYVYGYLPNKNNCLSSIVYYYSYAQHFSSPLEITFAASYDDEGRIKSLRDDADRTLNSGELQFKSVVYECH